MKNHRNYWFVLLLSLLVCFACEKPLDEEGDKDKEEYYVDDDGKPIDDDDDDYSDPGHDDDDGSDDSGSSTDQSSDEDSGSGNGSDSGSGNGSDNDSSDDEEDMTEDSSVDDRTTPYDETDISDGDQGEDLYACGDTITVAQFLLPGQFSYINVKGYIVGCCQRNVKNADFVAPFDVPSNLLLADSPDERDTEKMMSVELRSGTTIRDMLNLKEHPEMLHRKILVSGYREKYLGIYGIKGINKEFKIYR